MYTLISILLPSVIGVKIIEHINKGLSLKNTAYYYLILLTLSTILNSLISFFCFKVEDTINLLNKSTIYFVLSGKSTESITASKRFLATEISKCFSAYFRAFLRKLIFHAIKHR